MHVSQLRPALVFARSQLAQAQHSDYHTGSVQVQELASREQCTVYSHGCNVSDVLNIVKAFEACNDGGTLIFPEDQNYFIGSKLNPVVRDVTTEWRGVWTYSPEVEYWRQSENHYPVAYQNHAASFVLTGDGIRIDGYDTGGIEGTGDVWYIAEVGASQPGRPMGF